MSTRISSLLLIAALAFSHHGCGTENPREGSSGHVVVLETSLGEIAIELGPQKAPKTVENFLAYVDEGMDVADAIAVVPTRPRTVPVEPILIVSARRR